MMAEFSYLFYTLNLVKIDEDLPFSPKEWFVAAVYDFL